MPPDYLLAMKPGKKALLKAGFSLFSPSFNLLDSGYSDIIATVPSFATGILVAIPDSRRFDPGQARSSSNELRGPSFTSWPMFPAAVQPHVLGRFFPHGLLDGFRLLCPPPIQ